MDEMKEAHEERDSLRRIAREKKQDVFIAALAEWGTKKKALEIAKIPPSTYAKWYGGDYEFSKRCEEARFSFGETLEGIALERVMNPDKGRGSDVLLLGLLNANMPAKYRPSIAIDQDSAKELISEWRKASQVVKKEVPEEKLPVGVEKVLEEILEKRGNASKKDDGTEKAL